MANRIVRTPRGRLDLIEIWEFIAEDNEPAADRMLDRMKQALAMLRNDPLAGRTRPALSW